MTNDNSTGQNYWFTEHGEWGTVDVEYIHFVPEHHANIHDSFDMVSDWEYPEWARFLAKRPHVTTGESELCETCEALVVEFHEAKAELFKKGGE